MARHGAVDAYDQFFSEISAATFLEPSLTCTSTRVNHQYHVHKNASAIKSVYLRFDETHTVPHGERVFVRRRVRVQIPQVVHRQQHARQRARLRAGDERVDIEQSVPQISCDTLDEHTRSVITFRNVTLVVSLAYVSFS